jgi:GNAT acetyltransferase-like protein
MPGQCVVVDSVTAFSRDDWDNCFPGEIENWNYYRSVEQAGIPDFSWQYFAVVENDRLLAVIPAFRTVYRLDTTAQGVLKRLLGVLARWLPKIMALPLLCLGSPTTEACRIGFAPGVADGEKRILLAMLIDRFRQFAREQRIGLLAVKDARDRDRPLWQTALTGFSRVAGLPTATLGVPFGSLDDYLKSLSRATRKDMRRKLRMEAAVRVESRTSIDDVIDRIAALYEETMARSELRFEQLPPAYFSAVLANMPGKARCVLYWHGENLLAFNLVLESREVLVDKFVGASALARDYNVYFLSWMENVRHCVSVGIPIYQSGQAGYAVKVRLGSRLLLNWNYFLHANPALNAVLRLVAVLVRLDRFDPEIRVAIHGIK